MTNAEKYLKDGVSLQELCCDFIKFCNDRKIRLKEENELEHLNDGGKLGIFLQQNIKPTLTDDERVILKNIHEDYKHLKRTNNGDLYVGVDYFGAYSHLFQFIKERRRI